jgi:hypothetical protein
MYLLKPCLLSYGLQNSVAPKEVIGTYFGLACRKAFLVVKLLVVECGTLFSLL